MKKKVAVLKLYQVMADRGIRKGNALAKKADLSEKHIYRLLSGEAVGMNFDTMGKLCRALDCKIDELIVLEEVEDTSA